MNERILWYIADPMCSWCWGFAPIVKAIRLNYSEHLKIEPVMGGLRPGTKLAMASEQRAEILSHWKAVNRRTGQPFSFEGAMPEGFIYDTEPSCRGVVAMSLINPELVFSLLESIQFSFYVEQKDVTNPRILAQLAGKIGIDMDSFLQVFESDEAKNKVSIHFNKVRRWGVNSFPTVAVQNAAGYSILNRGYCTLDALCLKIDGWLNT
jgi:putative protein-disulfide isomerase